MLSSMSRSMMIFMLILVCSPCRWIKQGNMPALLCVPFAKIMSLLGTTLKEEHN